VFLICLLTTFGLLMEAALVGLLLKASGLGPLEAFELGLVDVSVDLVWLGPMTATESLITP